MKNHALQIISILPAAALSLCSAWTGANAQNAELIEKKTLPVQVGVHHTVSVRFPLAITSVDRGSAQLLAQKVVSAENVLLLKAGTDKMQPTSLMVITADGALYSFQVQYSSQAYPTSLELLATGPIPGPENSARPGALPALTPEQHMTRAQHMPSNLSLHASTDGIQAHIDGLYISDEKIYLRFSIENLSQIGYELASMHFSLADKRQPKRTAAQQKQIMPLAGLPAQRVIQPGEQQTMLIPLAKLTINGKKYLAVQIHEKHGDRNLTLRLKARHFRRIKAL